MPTNHRDGGFAGAPERYVPDCGGGRFAVPGGGISLQIRSPAYNGSYIDAIDLYAKQSISAGSGPLCYWSFQSLPAPPKKSIFGSYSWVDHYDFAGLNMAHPHDSTIIRNLGELATGRLQALIDESNTTNPVVGGFCTQGRDHAKYLCEKGLYTGSQCDPRIFNQSKGLRWPVSSAIFKFDGTNKDTVTAVVKSWRASPAEHYPNIESPVVTVVRKDAGWGFGGGLVAKLFPCKAIPTDFKYQKNVPQDSVRDGQAGTVFDEALRFWTAGKGYPTAFPDVPS